MTSRVKSLKLVSLKSDISWKWQQANPNPTLSPRDKVGVNSWENDKRWESETKWKRWASSKSSRVKPLKFVSFKNFMSWKWPQANPNPNPKRNPRVRVGVNSWENDKR